MDKTAIRPFTVDDIPFITSYWINATPDYLRNMGADPAKIPDREKFYKMLENQLNKSIFERQTYGVVWLLNQQPIGHCNVNPYQFGLDGYMHLHVWEATNRAKGIGTELVKKSVAHFFEVLDLQTVYSEPYALNPSPNQVLKKVGFSLEKKYRTTPGGINFEQEVNRWRLDK